MEPSAPLASDTGSKPHHPTMRMMGDHGGRLEIERERVMLRYTWTTITQILRQGHDNVDQQPRPTSHMYHQPSTTQNIILISISIGYHLDLYPHKILNLH